MTQDTADAAPASRRLSRRRAVLISAIALILIAAIALVAVSCTNSGQNGPPTVRVDRGTVALAVSASGTIAPSGRQSLGFADGGPELRLAFPGVENARDASPSTLRLGFVPDVLTRR